MDDDSRFWRLTVFSEGATSLNVLFDAFELPPGAELYAVNERTGNVVGPFTSFNNKPHGGFALAPMPTDAMTFELWLPAEIDFEPVVSIESVVHGYRSMELGHSGRCNIDVMCPEAEPWRHQVRSVAMMLTADGQGYCSGAIQ